MSGAEANMSNMSPMMQGALTAAVGAVPIYYGMRTFMRGPTYRSSKRLDGQTVVVTGANSGIGQETVKELCRRGARVLLLCRNQSKGIEAAEQIEMELK